MRKVIGPASDFYRVRVTRLDMGGDIDFDWRDDVLWRSTGSPPIEECDVWVLEALELFAGDRVMRLATFGSAEEAHEALKNASQELGMMTKAEFEAAYLGPLGYATQPGT